MTAATDRHTHELCLRNGLRVSLRPVGVDDEPEILKFLTNLSAESRRRRFFTVAIDLRAETHREMARPPADQHGLLARAAGRGVVGHAIYVRLPLAKRAEVAVEGRLCDHQCPWTRCDRGPVPHVRLAGGPRTFPMIEAR